MRAQSITALPLLCPEPGDGVVGRLEIVRGHLWHRYAYPAWARGFRSFEFFDRTGKLELHFLPGYAPELNPDELVWNYMKRTGVARRPLAAGEVLQDCIDAQMKAIGENPALVRAFFRNKDVAYITD